MPDPTLDVIEELWELEKNATPGPWRWDVASRYVDGELLPIVSAGSDDNTVAEIGHDFTSAQSDVELIAAMRNALPSLLDHLEAAERVVEAMTRIVTDYDPPRHVVIARAALAAYDAANQAQACTCGFASMSPKDWIGVPDRPLRHGADCPKAAKEGS